MRPNHQNKRMRGRNRGSSGGGGFCTDLCIDGRGYVYGGLSGHIERQTSGRDGHRQACLWQASAYDPGGFLPRRPRHAKREYHLVKMSFARGRKMKASAELRAMLEVDPTGLGRV